MPARGDRCPDCGDPLPGRGQRCGSCGWQEKAGKGTGPRLDGRCSFTVGDLRCPFGAVWFDQPYALTGGFCRLHSWPEYRLTGPEGYEEMRKILTDPKGAGARIDELRKSNAEAARAQRAERRAQLVAEGKIKPGDFA